ncbi:MAG: DedA family protein [Nanoarchaeales archaeon]|nr:DedA family protein [Nanoarchaeales archaeon]
MLEPILLFLQNFSSLEIFIIFSFLCILNGIILLPSSQLILIIAGIISVSNGINPILFLIILIIANVFGNYILYKIGYKYGEKIVKKIIPMKKEKLENHLLVLDYLFKKYGNYIILIGRNLPIFHSLVSIPAGLSKIPSKQFLIYSTLGITIWSYIFFILGIKFIDNYQTIIESMQSTFSILIIILFITIVIVIKIYYKKALTLAKAEHKKKKKNKQHTKKPKKAL